METKYNTVYQTLVGDIDKEEANIIGIVAYALYKADKIGFIVDYRNKNSGTMPSIEEINSYCQHLCTGNHLERYKKDARETLGIWLNDRFKDSVTEVENACNARNAAQLDAALERERPHIKDIVDESINKSDKGYLYGLTQSILGAALYTIIIAIIIVGWSITNRHVITISPEGIKVEAYTTPESQNQSSKSPHEPEQPFSDSEKIRKN